MVKSHVSLLVSKLHQKAESGTPVDIMRWLNFTTFDIFGDLCFAESFGSLESEEYNEWIANLFNGLKFIRLFRFFRMYPLVGIPFFTLMKVFPAVAKAKAKHEMYTIKKTEKRMSTKTDRKDFMRLVNSTPRSIA